MADITINASPTKKLSVELVGVEYMVRPPKMAVLAVVAKAAASKGTKKGQQKKGEDTIKHIEDLVKIMFQDSADKIFKRLADAGDELDYQEIMNTAEAVIEAQTGNPTSSQPASSEQ